MKVEFSNFYNHFFIDKKKIEKNVDITFKMKKKISETYEELKFSKKM